MTVNEAETHEHELDAEYLSAADLTVFEIYPADDSLRIDLVVPCPTCSEPLRVTTRVTAVAEADIELPLDDAADPYD
ncbi:hypothetical protein [Natronorubrum halophilum]|uniref:hypothetical protein n=1 Tax=Natronorubrum halophilum TaxID=1702106 RepID=UPI0010C1FFF9|nr:hypothetical protein [Natronorubrum halophilum]